MGYTVKHGETTKGHFETKEEAYQELKRLNMGVMPRKVHTSPGNIERYSDYLENVISVIPDPAEYKSS